MENMKKKLTDFFQSIKTWTVLDWIINFRYVGYGVILLHAYLKGSTSIPELVIFGGIVGLIEKQVRKK
jgi:hypothetical protein